MKVDWNLPIPHNMKSFLTSSSNKQQLIDLFVQKLLIDRIHVKQATGDAYMLIVKVALTKAEEFNNIVVNSRNTGVFITLLQHLDSDIHSDLSWKQRKAAFPLVK